MAIVVTCPACGNLSQVPDQAAGSAVRCPHCAAVMAVPGSAPTETQAAPGAGSRTPNYFNVVTPAPAAYMCATCGGRFAAADVLDQHGTIICQNCYAAAVAQHADDADFLSAHSIPAPSDEHVVSEEDHSDRHDDVVSFAPVAASAESSSASAPGKRPTDFLPLLVGGAFGIIILGAVIVYVTSNDSRPPVASVPTAPSVVPNSAPTEAPGPTEWEQKNGPHLERLRAQAKSLEASGDLPGALTRYQDMLNFAADPSAKIRSDSTLAELADARTRWEALVKVVKPVDQTPPPPTPDQAVASAGSSYPKWHDTGKPSVPATETEKPEKHTTPSATEPAVAENPTPKPKPGPEPTPAPAVAEDEANWAANHLDQVRKLLVDAPEAAKGADKVAALAKYEQLLRLVQGHEKQITDADLKKALAAANDQRKQLLAAVRDSDETKQATASSLLAAGLKSLRDGKWKTAEESLTDARHVSEKMSKAVDYFKDAGYVATLHALAVAYLENKNVQRAGEMFDDGAPLGRIASTRPTREMIWNRAVTDVTQKFNIMRTVKMLRDYLEKHPDPPDEDLINLFGTACSAGDETNPANRKLLDDAIGYYQVLNTQLEKTHPGQKRWGAQWLPEAEAQAKYDDQSKYIEIFQQKLRDKEMAGIRLKEAQQNAAGIKRAPGAEAAVTAAKNALTDADRAATAARAAIPRAAWLTDLKPMIPPDTVVAMVTPPPASSLSPSPGPSGSSALPDSSTTPPPNATPAPSTPSTSTPAPAADPAPPPVVVPTREVRYAAAFPVDKTHLVTAADPLGSASAVRLEDTQGNVFAARVVAREGKLALLEVSPGDAGGPLRYFNLSPGYSGGPVRCAAIPEANVFGPSVALLNGDSVPVPRGPKWSVGLSEHPRLAGSPLLDGDNAVIGVVVADREDPKTRLPSIPVKDISDFLQAQHVMPGPSPSVDPVGIYQVAAESE